ncbi:DUF2383 domain-containing protein [Senegalia massiliensis]|uniref:DUF2383 domain-containing protein n=1 Tax=Senegalia massiliensis TaxID=1720316 RepID=A0A845QYZ2_9CLOT|nr:DUF2383 domain-containing protein [Senegalia massiliensis]NBI06372.1 DUF2383 domain-containing protein [Senegalia massiliensis]
MNKKIEEALISLLQGEYMALDSFNVFISKLENKKNKDVFQEIQKGHRENIAILSEYIQNIGGMPDENLGLKGNMAELKLKIETHKKDDDYIINKALEGQKKGINMAEKVLRGNLDDKSRDIVGEILHRERKNTKELEKLN